MSEEIFVTDEEWEEFKKAHSKSYKDATEEQHRRGIFLDAKKRVAEHNKKYEAGETTWTMGINQFSDLTPEEFKNQNKCFRPAKKISQTTA